MSKNKEEIFVKRKMDDYLKKDLSFDHLYKLYKDLKIKTIELKEEPVKRKRFELEMIAIKKYIDLKECDFIQDNVIYPDYNDPNFSEKITKKAEFFYNSSKFNVLELEKKCLIKNFELGNHQILLKNFIQPNSPYNSLLIFHGVGVGKTCSGVTISNSFRDIYMKNKKKRIIILVPKNIQPGWKNTIYNPKLGEKQCTGDTFDYIIRNKTGFNEERGVNRKIKKTIKEFYEIYGYQEFSNQIKKLIELKKKTNRDEDDKTIERQVIKEYFSDRLLIVDEVHNIRSEKSEEKKISRDTIININKVIEYSDNLKLILLSATPMFNQPTEILWLMNMLLKNDSRPTISESEIFKDNKLTESGKKLLEKKCKGYISYLRGENPITFPIRLYPKDNILKFPEKDFNGNDLTDQYRFRFMNLYQNIYKPESEQAIAYENFIESYVKDSKKLSLSLIGVGKQISNIVYPNGLFGENGLKKCLKYSRKQYSYIKGYPKMFDQSNIEKYSVKIKNIVDKIKSSEGIIFVYSEYIYSGIIPLALALEHCGYQKFSGNLLNEKEKEKVNNRGNYIILSGDPSLSPNNEKEIKSLTSIDNKNGEKIKIVIGSTVASEGLDLKNIREIHIMDPWFHLNRLEQIVGRGIRFCSHIMLDDPKKRNVTVYLHAGVLDPNNESIDTYIYREAESKASDIGQVEMVLKENAIDCQLNSSANTITNKDVLNATLIDSQGKKHSNVEIFDKDFSKICSWGNCGISCIDKINKIKEKDIDYSTFNVDYSKETLKKIKNIILFLFSENNYYNLDDLKDKITDEISTNEVLIYYAVSEMIDEKEKVWDMNGNQGYIINSDDIYMFQPLFFDELPISYHNRNNNCKPSEKYFYLEKPTKEILDDKSLLTIDVIESFKEKLKTKISEYLNSFDLNDEYILNDFTIDHLKYSEKQTLIERILINNDYQNPYFKSVEKNLIKKDLTVLEEKPFDIIGYFITNYKNNKVEFYKFNDTKDSFVKLSSVEERRLIKNIKKKLNLGEKYGYSYRNKNGKYLLKYIDTEKYPKGVVLSSDNIKKSSIIDDFNRINHFSRTLMMKKYGRNELSDCMDILLRHLFKKENIEIFFDYDIFNLLNLKK